MPVASQSSPRMPGDIFGIPPQQSSGYASSGDDHFSDAPEENESFEEQIPSEPHSANPNNLEDTTGGLNASLNLPLKNTQVPDESLSVKPRVPNPCLIPGAFGSDDFEELKSSPSSNPKNTLEIIVTPNDSAPILNINQLQTETQPETGTQGKIQTEAETKAQTEIQPGAEIESQCNEKTDTIPPAVSTDRGRIEPLVNEQETSQTLPFSPPGSPPVYLKDTIFAPSENGEGVENDSSEAGSNTPLPESITSTLVLPVDSNEGDTNTDLPDLTDAAQLKDDGDFDKAEGAFGGDDFDEFGDAVEVDDFNDFDDFGGFQEGEVKDDDVEKPLQATPPQTPQISIPSLPISLPNFADSNEIENSLSSAVEKMFSEGINQRKLTGVEGRPFLTERSLSLWNQLVAPPPLQPPNWKISRIRRLFLVSLGIPVDLDEILPTETKQKKLVLPSIHLPQRIDSRPSSRNSRRSGSMSRKKRVEHKDKAKANSLNIPDARILCSTSATALKNFTAQELQEHINKLQEITTLANEVLAYWITKRDGAISDKETFETVIESLVGYARKKRQNG